MSRVPYKKRGLGGLNIADYTVDQLKELVGTLLDNKIHGLSFSPYLEGQEPGDQLSEEQVRERLAIIAPHINWVRTFSCTEGNELIAIIAREFGLKTLVGVWLDDNMEKNAEEMQGAEFLVKQGCVDMLGVGNEILLRGELSESQLIGYIRQAQAFAPGIPVGYVDAYYEFEDHPEVSDACDVIFANCYPFWEGYPMEHSLVYLKDMYRRAQAAGKGKPVIVSETGWPNVGTAEGAAEPGYENAIAYFLNVYQWAEQENVDIFYFSSFDEAWKVAAEGDVGAYWGLWDKDGKPKYW
ncbi:MAG: glycosyl hydrolase [Alteromonadaceae bacterium]|nr:glycosyl hydrolase [Alteromonadaceae bacterium]